MNTIGVLNTSPLCETVPCGGLPKGAIAVPESL